MSVPGWKENWDLCPDCGAKAQGVFKVEGVSTGPAVYALGAKCGNVWYINADVLHEEIDRRQNDLQVARDIFSFFNVPVPKFPHPNVVQVRPYGLSGTPLTVENKAKEAFDVDTIALVMNGWRPTTEEDGILHSLSDVWIDVDGYPYLKEEALEKVDAIRRSAVEKLESIQLSEAGWRPHTFHADMWVEPVPPHAIYKREIALQRVKSHDKMESGTPRTATAKKENEEDPCAAAYREGWERGAPNTRWRCERHGFSSWLHPCCAWAIPHEHPKPAPVGTLYCVCGAVEGEFHRKDCVETGRVTKEFAYGGIVSKAGFIINVDVLGGKKVGPETAVPSNLVDRLIKEGWMKQMSGKWMHPTRRTLHSFEEACDYLGPLCPQCFEPVATWQITEDNNHVDMWCTNDHKWTYNYFPAEEPDVELRKYAWPAKNQILQIFPTVKKSTGDPILIVEMVNPVDPLIVYAGTEVNLEHTRKMHDLIQHHLAKHDVGYINEQQELKRLRELNDKLGWLTVMETIQPGDGEKVVEAIERSVIERDLLEQRVEEMVDPSDLFSKDVIREAGKVEHNGYHLGTASARMVIRRALQAIGR